MYHFVLQIIIMLSLGMLVYMAARKIPQISDTVPEENIGHPKGFWHQIELILGKLPLDKFDFAVSQFLEKNIRKMKLFLARLDNYLTHHLEQFKKVKQRAHRKQEKKFALFESTETSERQEDLVTTAEREEGQSRSTESSETLKKEESGLAK
ncbi:MAG: hypothetical protein UY31_C0002G0017 [Candidatus Wolfebacteria bacterium GW2011_GWE1_48_7]|uniref:Uncharacterized protein n=2 Tax=Candidatus Wolfeibacteriota TaxID=1752735 RepID=A0A0G1U7U0_9BACT|nr:MAG: hypothetical protein UX70_C0001G0362 [Candidatus Wolfebacteria bacterium GW2011_GWB1_47_1]KKU36490.1 MAG: hypothetical protein UX49_C0015G0016 [Candidatus Wolfebacteria bacterium GW2011_GWC2_46_275]KKU42572.1 MAG: hypothetical protein UX58_C0001G0004 [Candidatus Wolfebacteria bacterium GW2011_GWB2_46_69]KKU54693.1 MAG: hypothetical protein UX76_C0001G0152 [Candidatus Wolfebacteria bacterium GW2011_GWC1_47_103]KKU58758.1 MAG: hypothetical protein UX83_C0012G0019 [Candidatus Wolfebacteria